MAFVCALLLCVWVASDEAGNETTTPSIYLTDVLRVFDLDTAPAPAP
eukprot:COSAG04_NODE_18749_length_433_cov_1.083832_1_plen_46_part_10